MSLWVVKLGGSLACSARLPDWLAAVAAGGGDSVLVPGGGPFADAVRAAQRRWPFDDTTAHQMALLAMHQYGLLLGGLRPELVAADSVAAMAAARRAGRIPVWLPAPMVLAAAELEASWRLTSDSLALWLARRLNASRLVLVKSVTAPAGAGAQTLAEAGIVDPLFPRYARGCDCAIVCLGPDEPERLAQALATGGLPGTPLPPEP